MILSFLGFPFCVAFRRSAWLINKSSTCFVLRTPASCPIRTPRYCAPCSCGLCLWTRNYFFCKQKAISCLRRTYYLTKKDFLCTQNTCTKSLVQQFLFRRPRILANRTDEIYTGLLRPELLPLCRLLLSYHVFFSM